MNTNLSNLEKKGSLKITEEQHSQIHGEIQELLRQFCHVKANNEISINYECFKRVNIFIEKSLILNYLIYTIETVLKSYDTFTVHANIKKVTLLEIDKNKDFIFEMSNILKTRFNDKLDLCFIYEGSFIFKQIYNLLSTFIDKSTMNKIRFS
jgi:hypothetical protein